MTNSVYFLLLVLKGSYISTGQLFVVSREFVVCLFPMVNLSSPGDPRSKGVWTRFVGSFWLGTPLLDLFSISFSRLSDLMFSPLSLRNGGHVGFRQSKGSDVFQGFDVIPYPPRTNTRFMVSPLALEFSGSMAMSILGIPFRRLLGMDTVWLPSLIPWLHMLGETTKRFIASFR